MRERFLPTVAAAMGAWVLMHGLALAQGVEGISRFYKVELGSDHYTLFVSDCI